MIEKAAKPVSEWLTVGGNGGMRIKSLVAMFEKGAIISEHLIWGRLRNVHRRPFAVFSSSHAPPLDFRG